MTQDIIYNNLPPRCCFSGNPLDDAFISDKIRYVLSQPCPSSAPAPDGIMYSVWEKLHDIHSGILVDLHSPLVTFDYDPL